MKHALTLFVFTVASFFSFQNATHAAAVPDRGFGTNGTVTTTLFGDVRAERVKIQPNGKIVVLGNIIENSGGATLLIRYNPDGSLDTNFGNQGIVVMAFATGVELSKDFAFQSDGKIVVAGTLFWSATSSVDFFVARLTEAGVKDPSFGTNGLVTINQSSTDTVNSVAVGKNDTIYAAGSTSQNGGEAVVMRFSANGSLDDNFGDGGLVFVNNPSLSNEGFDVIALPPSDPPVWKILVGGRGSAGNGTQTGFVMNLNGDGSICDDFGTNCTVNVASGPGLPAVDVKLLPSGKILTVSNTTKRFLGNGEPDADFISDGPGSRIALRSDDRFVVGGGFVPRVFAPGGRWIGTGLDVPTKDLTAQTDDKIVFLGSEGPTVVLKRATAITSQATRLADFDSDEKTDLIYFTPGNGTFYRQSSQDGTTIETTSSVTAMRPIPERFDILRSDFVTWSTPAVPGPGFFRGEFDAAPGEDAIQWGNAGDIPVGGDYTGDGYSEFAVFRPSDGTWWAFDRSNFTYQVMRWGTNGDRPVPADYDYDGITDFAVYRPSTGTWWILRSSDGSAMATKFGLPDDLPATGDFDGDGRADLTVFRPSEGNWYQLLSTEGFRVTRFGLGTDRLVPGDYDGDGRHDIAVYREGTWYILQSTAGLKVSQFGSSGDFPVAVRYDW